ncbi:MAG: hypothetical protein MK033_08885 [Candidatus Caenarcaniphilales bacterium]|nr:hypothetical protein [Candidatus Caenarcaniphilales bacterium]
MDPYFRPILISSLITVLLNTVLVLPFLGAPLLNYFIGGFLASVFFKSGKEDKFYELSILDSSILGIGCGLISGSLISLIISWKLQNADVKKILLDMINEQLRMQSQAEMPLLTELEPGFYIVLAIVILFMASLLCFFGSTVAIAFVNKEKK